MIEESVFDKYSQYYDLLYGDKDYDAETAYVNELLSRHGVDKGEVLEFGSGTGRHGTLLAGLGHTVFGVERSQEMVNRSRSAPRFSCTQGDITSIDLGQTFDAVLALFHVVSYQTQTRDVLAVFENAFRHLRPGGIFAFDYWYSPAVAEIRPSVRVKRVRDANYSVTRVAEPRIKANENIVEVGYTVFAEEIDQGTIESFEELHSMRHFSLPEILQLASVTGFEHVASAEFLTGNEPGADTWGVCTVLRKPGEL